MLWQPEWYPQCLPFRYCAPSADFCEPKDVPPGSEGREVIVVTRKSEHWSQPHHWKAILVGRKMTAIHRIDGATRVYVFSPR